MSGSRVAKSAATRRFVKLRDMREEDVVASVAAGNVAAARALKNAVIGNRTNKRAYLRAAALEPLVAAAAKARTDPLLSAEAIAALGSIACGLPEGATAVVDAGAVPLLIAALDGCTAGPTEAAVRALKVIASADVVARPVLSTIVASAGVALRFVLLMETATDGLAEVCAVILARCCIGVAEAAKIDEAGGVDSLVSLLDRARHPRATEAALDALSALTRANPALCGRLCVSHGVLADVAPLVRSTVPSLSLAACRLLTRFHSAGELPARFHDVMVKQVVEHLASAHKPTREAAPRVLATLITDCEALQRIATEAGAVERLAEILLPKPENDVNGKGGRHHHSDIVLHGYRGVGMPAMDDTDDEEEEPRSRGLVTEGALVALAAICSRYDEARESVIKLQLLPGIVEALGDTSSQVVLGALNCVHSLSRSLKIVRSDIASDNIGEILLRLLESDNIEIQRSASATVCNVVMDFSPIKHVILSRGGTAVLVRLLQSEDNELRLHALSALKNMLFRADPEVKAKVMAELGYDTLHKLCVDECSGTRENAMIVVRNLACPGPVDSQTKHLDALFAGTGDRLIELLQEVLRPDTQDTSIAEQALYVVCNIASGAEKHKVRLMVSDIPQLILGWTSHTDDRVRIAAIWCAINLSWKEPAPRPASHTMASPAAPTRPSLISRPSRRQRLLREQHLPFPSTAAARAALDFVDAAPRWMQAGLIADNASIDNAARTNASAVAEEHSAAPVVETAASRPQQERDNIADTEPSNVDEDAVMQPVEQANSPVAAKSTGYEWRIERLRELGFEGRLRLLVNDPHVEVQGRARAALEQFACGDVSPLDYDPSALLAGSPVRPPPVQPMRTGDSEDSSALGVSEGFSP